MEILNDKYQNFIDAYAALGEAIISQQELQIITGNNAKFQNLFTAGIIQHFELTYETAWKFLKEYVRHKHDVDVASPKAVFRSCRELRVLSDGVVDGLLELADVRNLTAHVYNRILAQEVGMSIEQHYKVFEPIAQLLK